MSAATKVKLTAEYANVMGGVAWSLLTDGVVMAQGRASCFLAAQTEVHRETASFHRMEAAICASLLEDFAGRKVDAEMIDRIVDRATALGAIRRQLA